MMLFYIISLYILYDINGMLGSYVYLEASSPAAYGQKAILTSMTMRKSQSGTKCLMFWYHMYGTGMGSLKVIAKDVALGTESLLVTLSGNQGDNWKEEKIDISTKNDFQVRISKI